MECKGHTGPVCALDAIYVEESNILVASAASDSTVRLWLCSEAKEGNKTKHSSYSLIRYSFNFFANFVFYYVEIFFFATLGDSEYLA